MQFEIYLVVKTNASTALSMEIMYLFSSKYFEFYTQTLLQVAMLYSNCEITSDILSKTCVVLNSIWATVITDITSIPAYLICSI